MELTCVPCICSDGDKLAESDTATGSGEVPVNQTPTLNETTTAAQSFLGMVTTCCINGECTGKITQCSIVLFLKTCLFLVSFF
ncbi:unnamed protein product [Brassica oleracea var. botrytis]